MNDKVTETPETNPTVEQEKPAPAANAASTAPTAPAETPATPSTTADTPTTTPEESASSFEAAPPPPSGPSGLSKFMSGTKDLFAKNKMAAIGGAAAAVLGFIITKGFGAVLLGSIGLLLGGALGDKGGNIREMFSWIGNQLGLNTKGNGDAAGRGEHRESSTTRGARNFRNAVANAPATIDSSLSSGYDALSTWTTDATMGLNPFRKEDDPTPPTMGEQIVGGGASALIATGGGMALGATAGAGTIIGATAISDAGLGILGTGATAVGATATVATAATVGAVVVAAAGTAYLGYKAGSIANDSRKLYDYIDNAFKPDMKRHGNAVGAYTRLHDSLGEFGGRAIEYVDDYGETRQKYDLLLKENQEALKEAITHKKAEIREEMSNTYTGGWITRYVNYGSGKGRAKYESLKMDLRMLTSAEEELPHFLKNKEQQAAKAFKEVVAQKEAERAAQQAVADTKNVSGAQDATETSAPASTPAVAKTNDKKKDDAPILDDKGIPVASKLAGNDVSP